MFDSGWSDMVSGDTSILKIVMQSCKICFKPYYRYLYTPAHPVDLENFEGFGVKFLSAKDSRIRSKYLNTTQIFKSF